MEEKKGCFESVMPLVLLAFYAFAWGEAGTDSAKATTYLVLASALATLPFFLMLFFQNIVGGKMLALVIIFIGIFIPIVNILLAILMIITMFMKMEALLRSLPFILLGIALYALLWFLAPVAYRFAYDIFKAEASAWLACVFLGGGIFWFYLKNAASLGHNASRASALALGSACYLSLFLLFLFIPGGHDSGFDGDQQT